MAKRSPDKDNLSFHLTLLKSIPYRSKITATELYHSLQAQGFDKSLRTVQRALKKLADEYEIKCDASSHPYGYSRLSSVMPTFQLNGSQAAFIKIAERELADKVPHNLISAMTPIFNDANVVLRSGNQYAPEKMWMHNVRICYSSHPNLDPNIIRQLSSLIYERKQGEIFSAFHTQQMSPLGLFDTAETIYLIGKNDNNEILVIDLRHILSITPLTLSADIHPEFDIDHYISQTKLNTTQFDAQLPTISSDINKIERKIMSEYMPYSIHYPVSSEPKVHIIAKGNFGRDVLEDLSLPETDSLVIEYVEENEPIPEISQQIDILMVIAENFNHLKISPSDYNAEMLFFIGDLSSNPIEISSPHYFIHGQSIEKYRLFILMITEMLFIPGLINIDINDLKGCFSQKAYTAIESNYHMGDETSNRAELAAKEVINNLMKQSPHIKQAKSCLINIKADINMTLEEFTQIADIFVEKMGEESTVIVGTSLDMDLQGIRVSAAMVI